MGRYGFRHCLGHARFIFGLGFSGRLSRVLTRRSLRAIAAVASTAVAAAALFFFVPILLSGFALTCAGGLGDSPWLILHRQQRGRWRVASLPLQRGRTDWLAAATARLAAGEPPPADVFGGFCKRVGTVDGALGAAAGAIEFGLANVLDGGCCAVRVLPPNGGGTASLGVGAAFHPSLSVVPDDAEVARRATVGSPPDADTVWSVVDAYRERLYTPAGGGHGVPRPEWPTAFHRRRNASAALALDAIAVTHAGDSAAAAAAVAGVGGTAMKGKERRNSNASPTGALSMMAIPFTHYRLNAMSGELWAFDVTATAHTAPAAPGRAPPSAATPVAFKVVVDRPLDPAGGCTVSVIPQTPEVPLTLVLAYSNRPAVLTTFLAGFGQLRRRDTALALTISAMAHERAEVTRLVHAAGLPRDALPSSVEEGGREDAHAAKITDGVFLVTNTGDAEGNFSRTVALREGVIQLSPSALFMFIDVDMEVRAGALRNCRSNAVAGAQVWYPIVFSLYAGVPAVLTTGSGYWRGGGYGMVCAYRSEWDTVGGFGGDEEHRYIGWGKEDVDLYQKFRDTPAVALMRGLEPNLVHRWHTKECSAHGKQQQACLRTVTRSMASLERLADVLVEQGVDVGAALGVAPDRGAVTAA